MFFKPKWYGMLPDSLKPIDNETIRLIEEYRNRNTFPDETIFIAIASTKWAVRRIQKYTLELTRRQFPNLSEKELWKSVIARRLQLKLSSYPLMGETDPLAKPLSKEEIYSLIENLDKIVSNFKTFEDAIEYIIDIDEKENRFYDPTGIVTKLSNMLGSLSSSRKDSEPFLSEKNPSIVIESLEDQINKLKAEITLHRIFYQHGSSSISDKEYDSMKKKLQIIEEMLKNFKKSKEEKNE